MATLTRISFVDIRLGSVPRLAAWFGIATVPAVSFALLTMAIRDGRTPSQDQAVLEWVVGLDVPLLAGLTKVVGAATSNFALAGVGAVVLVFLWLLGMTRVAIGFAIVGAVVGAVAYGSEFTVGEIVGRSRPLDASSETSFPSGHVFASTVLFGIAGFLAVYYGLKKKLLLPILTILVALAAAVGFSRMFQQAHWPSDVAAGYLLGVFWVQVLATAIIYARRITWLSSPKQASDLAVLGPECESCRIASSIASTVVLNPEEGTATKVYKPPGLVRMLYWVAFQARFPYEHNRAALDAAMYRRKIGSALTIHRFGKDLVAHVSAVNCPLGPCEFVTDFVPGAEAENDEETREFLSQLTETFAEAGLSVWQINPHNPHAHTNIIYSADGDPIVVDLESATPIPAPGQWRSAMRRGNIPIFDDIDFQRLRLYVAENESALESSLGSVRFAEFLLDINRAELAIRTWVDSEPRIWGRLIRGVYRLFDWKRHFGFVSHVMENADKVAERYLNQGIERWESEGRLTSSEAESLRSQISSGDAQSALHHMGAHLVLSMIAVPIPGVRSVARFGWTLSFWVKTQFGRFRRGASKATSVATNIHSPLVMVLSLVPLLGGIAYMAARPLRRKVLIRLMMDQVAIKLPFRFYTRLRLSRLLAPSRG